MVASQPAMRDRVLGDFVLGDPLGHGGFGTVYRAEQRGLGRSAVVKVISKSVASRPHAADRFVREARLASRFDHPYAAHVYAFGIEPDHLMWIAMELVNGTPLDEMLRVSGPLPLERFVPLMERLCEVIESAHEQGIVHRDIKPSNVMVIARAGRLMPKLLDFGIAKLLETDIEPIADATAPSQVVTLDGIALEQTLDASSRSSSDRLTLAGQILGSPPYMAPEQWIDATTAGPLADQYALALLGFEALTGERAVQGPSLTALAAQHMHEPLPPLPAHLPHALHAVLARAADKRAEQRFASVLELARALRLAAFGAATEIEEQLPSLPPEMRAEWTDDAPRPIAEAIASLTSGGTAARVDERITAVAALLARWLGVTAIACRSQLGKLRGGDATETALLLALRRRPFDDGDWLDLAVALAREYAHRPAAWPVPEMATYLASGVSALRALLAVAGPLATADPEAARHGLAERLARLETALDELSWLLDYPLAREADQLEWWMGQRRDEPPALHGASDRSGDLVLLDGDGARIARLSPLIHVARPLPGEREEVFVLRGPGHSQGTARFASDPRGFERDDDRAWDWLAEHLLETAADALARSADDVAPYPGLAAFTARHRESFVGREREVDELINRLRNHPIVTVVGPSGIGKTSLLAAGLIPSLGAGWHAELVRPGDDPIAALGAIVERLEGPPYREAERAAPRVTPHAIASALATLAERTGTVVVIVDQAEELFTMCTDPDRRDRFAETVVLATRHPRIRVVIALRDDFLCRTDDLPAWRGLLGRAIQVLRIPGRDDLERMLTVPARRHGYDFDDSTLPGALVAAVADRPGALPLLAFAAAELWERRDRHFRRLTRAAYERIGGVTGALVQHADGVVDAMPVPQQRLVRLAFRRLIAADGTRVTLGRDELEAALGDGAGTVLDRLLAARLVVSRDAERGDAIEIIHETLASSWPRLASWRRDDTAAARLAEQLAAAARHWNDRGRPPELLWRGDALVELRRWLGDADRTMTQVEEAFARASSAAAIRTRRRRIGALVATFAVLAAGVMILLAANRTIADQRRTAVEHLAANFEERGRLAIADGDDARGLLYLAEASRLGAHGPGFDVLAAHAADALGGADVLGHGTAGILRLAANPTMLLTIGDDYALAAWDRAGHHTALATDIYDAALVDDVGVAVSRAGAVTAFAGGREQWHAAHAIAENSLGWHGARGSAPAGLAIVYGHTSELFDVHTGASRPLPQATEVSAAAFDARGTLVATGDLAGTVRVWDVATTALRATCEPHAGLVSEIVFAPDGATLVSAGEDRELRICEVATGKTLHRLVGTTKRIMSIDIAPDGGTIISAGRDGKPRLWDAHTGLPLTTLDGHRGSVVVARFSPDGTRILTIGADDLTARLWTSDGMPIGSMQGHGRLLVDGIWDGDNRHVVTVARDGAIRRWDTTRFVIAEPRHEHATTIFDLAVSHDDRWALSASLDGNAVLWDRGAHRAVAHLAHGAELQAVAFAPDDRSALTIDTAGAAKLWTVPDGRLAATLPHTAAAVYVPGGMITAGDRGVTFRAADTTELATVALGYVPDRLVLDPARRWLVVRGTTGAVEVIDVVRREVVTHLALRDHQALGVAVDATRVAITDGTSIRIWELGTWIPRGELKGHKAMVGDVSYLADGRLVSIADDTALVWSRDGAILATLTDGPRVMMIAQSADGALLATVSADGMIRILDGATYERMLVLPSHRTSAWAIQLAHDGRGVLSGGLDGRVVDWRLARRSRNSAELAELVRCRVPFRLDGDVAVPRDLDFDDRACQVLP